MRTLTRLGLVLAVLGAGACGRSGTPADDGLKNDLALASQAQPNALANVSPQEAGTSAPQLASRVHTAAAKTSTASHHSSARRSRARSSAGTSAGASSGSYPAPTPTTTIEKHTQRDAAIGAAAGAVLGAASSRNKVQGGIIGAAVGGVIGGVIGNNVDVQKRVIW